MNFMFRNGYSPQDTQYVRNTPSQGRVPQIPSPDSEKNPSINQLIKYSNSETKSSQPVVIKQYNVLPLFKKGRCCNWENKKSWLVLKYLIVGPDVSEHAHN